jgi:hypothetical protein
MITVRIHGGLGNQMFCYAFAKAFSLRANEPFELDPTTLFDPTRWKYLTPRAYALDIVFDMNPKLSLPSRVARALRIKYATRVWRRYYPEFFGKIGVWKYVAEDGFPFEPELLELRGDVYFDGVWQTEKYFKDYSAEIRKDFTFRNKLTGEVGDIADDIRTTKSVCLHVRRGDNANNPVSQKMHILAPMDYYERAVAKMREKIGDDMKLFVFSDDIPWCRENLRLAKDQFFVDDKYSGVEARDHLQLMSLCKHFIIPESSFSWWAAWLSSNDDKVVIAPDPWFKIPSIDTHDLVPEGWIKLPQSF